jgi:hypothetical protein
MSRATERRLIYWRSVCGCRAGALFFLAALIWEIVAPQQGHESSLHSVLRGAGVCIAAGLVGKAAAVLLSRAMYRAEVAWLARRIKRGAGERQVVT